MQILSTMTKLCYKPQLFQLPRMLRPGGHEINPSCVDRGMSQNIRQLDNIPAGSVKRGGKQVPQIVRKDLRAFHARLLAQRFHLTPNLASGNGLSASGEENFSRGGVVLSGILQQLSAELGREQDRADLPFQVNLRSFVPRGLHGDILYLRNADPGGADGFHQQSQPVLPLFRRRSEESPVLSLRQFPGLLPESPALHPEKLDPAVLPPQKPKQGIDRRQHGS